MDLPLPSYVRILDFLPQNEFDALLDWVLSNSHRFAPATIRSGDDQVVDAQRRVALTLGDIGPLKSPLTARFLDALPLLMKGTGAIGSPPTKVELELAAHGDGAHYRPHTDMPIGATRKFRTISDDRVLSAVLYFHGQPKRFSGGELRLYKVGIDPDRTDDGDFVELQPLCNSLVCFHSWIRHEVRQVSIESGRFADYRFAVNCWFRRRLE